MLRLQYGATSSRTAICSLGQEHRSFYWTLVSTGPFCPSPQQPLLGFGTHNGSKVPLSLLGWVLMIAGYEDAPPAPTLGVGG
jgi:hypothetical protein